MESVGDILKRDGHKKGTLNLKSENLIDEPNKEDPAYVARLLRLPNLEHTFSSFKRREGANEALKAFKVIAEGEADKPFIICYGDCGNGKTHLVEAMIIRLWERGIICPYYTFEDICQQIKRGMDKDSVFSADYYVETLSKRKYLVIDDFGLGSETKWVEGRLDVIIDYRYRYSLMTVLVTNRDLAELPPRVESRFHDSSKSMMVLNKASDYRKQKNL